MMQGPRAPFREGMPPNSFRNQIPGRPPMGPMMGAPMSPMAGRGIRGPGGRPPQMRQGGGGRPPQMSQGGGGILGKLLGRGNQARGPGGGAIQSASRAAGTGSSGSGGILKTLSNPGAINGFLTNTQKVLNTAQQFGPMVQQYGPLVKNIPSVWKLYRGLTSSTEESENNKVTDSKKQEKTSNKKKDVKKEIQIEQTSVQSKKEDKPGKSKPKLYV